MQVRIINYLLITSILSLLFLLLYSLFSYNNFLSILEKYISPDHHLDRPKIIISMLYAQYLYFIGALFLVKRYLLGSKKILPKKIEPLQYLHYILLLSIMGLFFTFAESKALIDETLFKEDGFFENMSVVFTLISSSIFFYLGVYNKAIDKRVFFFVLGILLFLFAMEEVSWGQRIFNLQTPESLKEVNYQNEINVHNIYINPHIGVIYYTFFLFVSSLFLFRDKYIKLFSKTKITKVISEIYPSNQFFYASFIYLFIAIATLKVDDELSEELLIVTIFIYSIELLYKKFKSKSEDHLT